MKRLELFLAANDLLQKNPADTSSFLCRISFRLFATPGFFYRLVGGVSAGMNAREVGARSETIANGRPNPLLLPAKRKQSAAAKLPSYVK